MLAAPEPTAYDLRFRLLGIPVRVHPLFWIVSALLGGIGSGTDFKITLMWIAAVFVSIVVHEMGHGLMTRFCGGYPRIMLYSMGGLCSSDENQSPRQRLAVLFWGPGAGFVLLALVLLVCSLVFQLRPGELLYLIQRSLGFNRELVGEPGPGLIRLASSPWAFIALNMMIRINLLWGLVNLLPIWPLDGGQIAGIFLTKASPRLGPYRTHVVSLVTAGVLAVAAFQYTGDMFLVLFFGLFALNNFQMMQALQHVRRGGFGEDAEDWWRR